MQAVGGTPPHYQEALTMYQRPRRRLMALIRWPVTRHPNRPVRYVGRVMAPYAVSLVVSLICALSWAGAR